jgi:hypothetical protein
MTLVPTRWGLAIALAIGLATAAMVGPSWAWWLGIWGTTHNVLSDSVLLAGAATSAVGAIGSSRVHRGGLAQLGRGAARSPAAVAGRAMTEIWLWIAAGYSAVYAVCLTLTGRQATVGRPEMAPWVAALALLALCLSLGWALGRRLSARIAGPLAFVGWYGALGVLESFAPQLMSAVTPIDPRFGAYDGVPAWILGVKAAWLTAATVGIVLLVSGSGRRGMAVLWLTSLLVAALVFVGPDVLEPRKGTRTQECVGSADPEVLGMVCLPRVKGFLAEQWLREQSLARGKLGALVDQDVVYVVDEPDPDALTEARQILDSRGINATLVPVSSTTCHSGQAQFDVTGWRRCQVEDAIGYRRGEGPRDFGVATPADVLTRWGFERLDLSLDGSAGPGAPILDPGTVDYTEFESAYEALSTASSVSRDAWFTRYRAQIRGGTLTAEQLAEIGS